MENVTEEHESFGVVQINRVTSSKAQSLFGSKIRHNNLVSLSIKHATRERSLSNEWVYAGEEIVEVVMSAAQFAEAITSLNHGTGVPVTINHLHNKGMAECPDVPVREEFEEDFKAGVKEAFNDIEMLVGMAQELQDKKTINKADRKVFSEVAERIQRVLTSNVPFVQAQFHEMLDQAVTEAKAEVEAHAQNVINGLAQKGIELSEEQKALPEITV